ncbi:MAG: ribonuclease P protein component [Candidatus Pacebacteria bacterium]|nr:ribonuclease P protein component [Candidatus Paceibacterota bacterium]MDD3919167.1 ribonuclease P protein component [Candidatus Paceibacterota bacterium]
MLKRENRLTKKKDFERVYKKGRGIKTDSLFLKILENEQEITRIGIVISKKVSKRAVIRNKIKRRIREIVKKSSLKPGFDLIIVTYPQIKEKDFQQLEEEINQLFKKAKCLNL